MAEFYAYFVRKITKDAFGDRFAYGTKDYVQGVKESWKQGVDNPPPAVDEEPIPPDFNHESALSDALSQSVDFALSGYQLILAAVAAPVFFSSAITQTNIVDPVVENAKLVEVDDDFEIYGLTEDQYFHASDRKESAEQMRKGADQLPAATLLGIVATFDSLVVDILGKLIRLDPRRLIESSQTVPIRVILEADSKEDAVSKIIADELYQFSRGSHEEQEKYISQNFGISIKENWKRWPDYIEIFERRNLIAHGERQFNPRYISICKRNGHKGSEKLLGDEIKLEPAYLRQALDVLVEFATLLPFALWRKRSPEDEKQAFSNMNDAVFKLVNNKRYVVAARLAEFALSLKTPNVEEEARRMLIVNRGSALRHSGDTEGATKLLNEFDWSATSDLFKICVASVRGEGKEVAALLDKVAKSGALSAQSFKRWPCFAFVRDDEEVRQAFSNVFGETINAKLPSTSTQGEASPPQLEVGDQSVH